MIPVLEKAKMAVSFSQESKISRRIRDSSFEKCLKNSAVRLSLPAVCYLLIILLFIIYHLFVI